MASLGTLCHLRNFADHNDLGNHQSVDERDGIVPILDVEFVQQKHAIGCESAKKESQIQRNPAEAPAR